MSEDQKQGYVVDLDAWSPTPAGTFTYRGTAYPAFHFAQLRQDQQIAIRTFSKRLNAAKGQVAIKAVYVDAILHFVPSLANTPAVNELKLESIDLLDFGLNRLLDPHGTIAASRSTARPTKGRRKKSASASAP